MSYCPSTTRSAFLTKIIDPSIVRRRNGMCKRRDNIVITWLRHSFVSFHLITAEYLSYINNVSCGGVQHLLIYALLNSAELTEEVEFHSKCGQKSYDIIHIVLAIACQATHHNSIWMHGHQRGLRQRWSLQTGGFSRYCRASLCSALVMVFARTYAVICPRHSKKFQLLLEYIVTEQQRIENVNSIVADAYGARTCARIYVRDNDP